MHPQTMRSEQLKTKQLPFWAIIHPPQNSCSTQRDRRNLLRPSQESLGFKCQESLPAGEIELDAEAFSLPLPQSDALAHE